MEKSGGGDIFFKETAVGIKLGLTQHIGDAPFVQTSN